jgi:16S rRNA (adenine1518-N6/adenine1519-N6)-dimethyltransferase
VSELLTATAIRELARIHGIHPSRALGQNFVMDPNTIRRVVRLAGLTPADDVLEVGAGLGTLTLGLADACHEVLAVEIDRAVLPALEEVVDGLPNVRILQGDAMALDWASVLGDGPWRMVSNLPYNISTPLIATLLEEVPQVADFLVMVQREAGERLVAGPGSKTYGAVSVLVALYAEAELVGPVPRTVFWPHPGVDTVLVRLTRRERPAVDVAPERLMRVVRASFAHRRKTMRNSLATALGRDSGEIEEGLRAVGVDPGARAESLALEDFARIAEVLG